MPGSSRIDAQRPATSLQVLLPTRTKEVQLMPVSQVFETAIWRSHADHRDGQARPARRRLGHRPLRRHAWSSGTANRSEPRPGLDFFPLTVDFEERMYAAGKIPGGFIKRESRPSEAAILAARLTDRPIRPLFPEGYKDDVQIVHHGPLDGPGERSRRPRHGRRLGRADDQRDPVPGPDRRRPRRPHRRRVRGQPDLSRSSPTRSSTSSSPARATRS